jgi:hypothetical protein
MQAGHPLSACCLLRPVRPNGATQASLSTYTAMNSCGWLRFAIAL